MVCDDGLYYRSTIRQPPHEENNILRAAFFWLYKKDMPHILWKEVRKMNSENNILRILSKSLRQCKGWENVDFGSLTEIRIRAGKPLLLKTGWEEHYFSDKEGPCKILSRARICTSEEIREIMEYITNYSIYAYEDELKNGFITIRGGHRIGICGRTVTENRTIINLRNISSLNIRVAHQVKGCGEKLVGYLKGKNTLIFSPPGTGKTTLLRDIIRLMSDGGTNVGVVDERLELAAGHLGEFQNDLGLRTDVMEGCPKAVGMKMLLRSMAPEVIAADELSGQWDYDAVCELVHCGVRLLTTIHADTYEEIKESRFGKLFHRFIHLERNDTGISARIYDDKKQILWEGSI